MANSKWEEIKEKLPLVEAWARDGLVDEQIAANLGISAATLYRYKLEHFEICEALKKGKEIVDFEVENQLLKRAMGYQYDEVTRELINEDDGEGGVVKVMKVTKVVTKEVIPDTTAQIFWLKNRKPKEWRDKQELSIPEGISLKVEWNNADNSK